MKIQTDQPIKCLINQDGTVSVEEEDTTGIKRSKILSFESFSQILTSDTESFELPLLPYGIKKYRKEGETLIIAIERPAGIIDNFNYYKRSLKSVPAPRSIWLTTLREHRGDSSRYTIIKSNIYALMMPLMSETQRMYDWPFPNHEKGYGICWGSSSAYSDLSKNCTLSNLSSLYSMYFSSKFNSDLGWKVRYDRSNFSSPIDFLAEKKEFSGDWLVPSDVTFTEACNYLLGVRNARN
jgi:hypothetical protein